MRKAVEAVEERLTDVTGAPKQGTLAGRRAQARHCRARRQGLAT